jgi:dolichyl-phosphate beta-glucosyltransferase
VRIEENNFGWMERDAALSVDQSGIQTDITLLWQADDLLLVILCSGWVFTKLEGLVKGKKANMKENQEIFLSIILPSYNEIENFSSGVLEEVCDYLKKQKYTYEVILTDDGSTDGTLTELQKFAIKNKSFHVIANAHEGKGPTVAAGMLAAQGQWRLFTDFDQSTPLNEVEKLLLSTIDHEIVIGSRAIQGAKRQEEPLYRHIMGVGFNLLVRLLVLPGVRDSQCGFKLFSANATKKLFPRLQIYHRGSIIKDAYTGAFDVELLFLARYFNISTAEIPVQWKHIRSNRVAPVKDSLRMLRDILRIRFASLRGRYGEK